MFFFEEVADDLELILATPQVRSGVRHHLRLVARPLLPHGLLGVLVEKFVGIEVRAVARHEAQFVTVHTPWRSEGAFLLWNRALMASVR